MTPSGFETIPSDFETISSDIEWFAHQIQRKTKGSTTPAGLTLGIGSQVLAYCCSRGLLLASVVGQTHCCSVVTVSNKNTVQLPPTFGCSSSLSKARALTGHRACGVGGVLGAVGRSRAAIERTLGAFT